MSISTVLFSIGIMQTTKPWILEEFLLVKLKLRDVLLILRIQRRSFPIILYERKKNCTYRHLAPTFDLISAVSVGISCRYPECLRDTFAQLYNAIVRCSIPTVAITLVHTYISWNKDFETLFERIHLDLASVECAVTAWMVEWRMWI